MVAAGFSLVGVTMIILGYAAGPVVSVEPESGTSTGTAYRITSTTASGGAAVAFSAPPPPPAGEWVWPVHKEDLTSTTYGLSQCWLHYYSAKDGYHAALDIRVNNKPVYAPHNGTVVGKYNDGYNTLIINTGPNAATGKTLYAVFEHMSSITVSNGQAVTKGQRIGTSGEVGAPGSPHLHFGISDSASSFGTYANPWHTANPIDFLPNDYSPALLTTSNNSCKTSVIKPRSDYGFAKYQTLGTFTMYK